MAQLVRALVFEGDRFESHCSLSTTGVWLDPGVLRPAFKQRATWRRNCGQCFAAHAWACGGVIRPSEFNQGMVTYTQLYQTICL